MQTRPWRARDPIARTADKWRSVSLCTCEASHVASAAYPPAVRRDEPRRCDGIRLVYDLPATDKTSSGAREREGQQQPKQAERDCFDRGKPRRVRPIISAKRFASRAASSLETDEEGHEQTPEQSGVEGDGHVDFKLADERYRGYSTR